MEEKLSENNGKWFGSKDNEIETYQSLNKALMECLLILQSEKYIYQWVLVKS